MHTIRYQQTFVAMNFGARLDVSIQSIHELLSADSRTKFTYCRALLNLVQEQNDIVSKTIMSDEPFFHLSDYVNKQNLRFWKFEMNEEPLHLLHVSTVWCGIYSEKLIGPFF